jgi:hypothetical protein
MDGIQAKQLCQRPTAAVHDAPRMIAGTVMA